MSASAQPSASFRYTPPPSAEGARRIVVKPNLGYPAPAPVTVSLPVLAAVLAGLRQVAPRAEIWLVEGCCSPTPAAEIVRRLGVSDLLDERMYFADADALPLADYPNLHSPPVRFATLSAPVLLAEADCRLSVGAFKRTTLNGEALISASLKNLYGLFPRTKYRARSPHARGQLHRPSVPLVLRDVYFCVGHLFEGAVVDLGQKFISADYRPDKGQAVAVGQVITGEDLLAVDTLACHVAQEPPAPYLQAIESLRYAKPKD